jgi:excinuclease ABC subunit B
MNGITPKTIIKKMPLSLKEIYGFIDPDESQDDQDFAALKILKEENLDAKFENIDKLIRKKTKQMQKAATKLDFEIAAELRNEIKSLRDFLLKK